MNKTILAFGVLILFILTLFTPIVFGGATTVIYGDADSIPIQTKTMLLQHDTSVICGYVTDRITNESLEHVACIFYYHYNGSIKNLWAFTNSSGFYTLNVPATDKWWLNVQTNYYYSIHLEGWNLGENETIWKNASLIPFPPENSILCGYIKDFWTQKPIEGAQIVILWTGEYGSEWYETMTNEYGFFSENIPEGNFECHIYKNGYWILRIIYYIEENETIWINNSLFKSRSKIASYYLYNFLERFPLLNLLLQRLRI